MKINFVLFLWVLLVLTFSPPYILIAGLQLKVIPYSNSKVGGYFPIDIEITIEEDLSHLDNLIRIIFSRLKVDKAICRELFVKHEPLEKLEGCSIGVESITIVINRIQLTDDKTIKFSISNVEYNSELAPKPLTVKVSDVGDNLIEHDTNNDDWIPMYPADFIITSVFPEIITTCESFGLIVTGSPSLAVAKDLKVEIVFDPNIDINSLDIDGSSGLSSIAKHSSGKITGLTSTDIAVDGKLEITLKNLKAPSTDATFKVIITTYSSNDRKVNSGDKSLTVTAKTLTSTGILALAGHKDICKDSNYFFTITQDCAPILSPSYKLNYAPGSQPQSGIFARQLPVTTSSDELNSNLKTVKVPLTNPCSVVPGSVLSDENYIIIVKDLTNKAKAFYYKLKLDSNIKYEPGSITEFEVTANPPRSADEADYYFTMKNGNPINAGGKIILTLGIPVKYTETPTITLTSHSGIIDTSLIRCSENKIEITLSGSISALSSIEIRVAKLLNPTGIASYRGFKAESFDHNGYAIDISNEASLLINSAGSIKVECIRDSKTNLATTKYRFTITSDKIEIMNNDVLGISVPSETILLGCITENHNPNFKNLADNIKCWLDIQSGQITSGKIVKFTYTNCQNAPTTETAKLNFYIYDQIGNKKLEGSVDITNDKGALITDIAVDCEQEFQERSSPCTLTFKRASKTPFQSVVLTGERLDLTDASCVYSDSHTHKRCEALQDGERMKIILKLNTKVTTEDVRINKVSIALPEYNTDYAIEIKTYSNEDPGTSPLVDEDIRNGLKRVCKAPCKQCEKDFSHKCLSCDESIQNKVYYLYPDGTRSCGGTPTSETNCRELESTNSCCEGYYDVNTPNRCLKCSSNCKNCQGTSIYCTECYDNPGILHNNECRANCPTYTYQVINTCKPCGANCRVCTSDTYCTTCESTHLIYEKGLERTCESNCGSGKYINIADQICRNCASPCATCIQEATTCESCDNLTLRRHLIKEGHKCVTAAECTKERDRVVDSAGDCVRCSNSCLTCEGTITNCLSCSGNLYLLTRAGQTENSCVADCTLHNSYNGEDRKCHSCISPCQSCISKERCTSCTGNFLLVPDKMECVLSCPDFYFSSGKNCEKCRENCKRCSDQSTCIECGNNHFLEGKECLSSCRDGHYNAGNNNCIKCNSSCKTCETSATNCIECANDYSWSSAGSNKCVSPCPDRMTPISGVCTSCHPDCASCSGSITTCTSCSSNKFLYNGACIGSCPSNTILKISTRTCVACPIQCEICTWNGSESSNIINCLTCASSFMYYNFNCVQHCSSGYKPSNDRVLCVRSSTNSNDPNEKDEDISSNDYLPFPHLITAGVIAIFIIAGQLIDQRTPLASNFLVVVNYVAIVSYISMGMSALFEEKVIITFVSVAVIVMQIVLNLVFLVAYKKSIATDAGFILWAKQHDSIKSIMIILSSILSLQTYRFLYSKLMGFETLFVKFSDFNNLSKPLNIFSVLQLVLVQLVIIIFDVSQLLSLSWKSNLYVFIIESLVLSTLVLLLLCYEIKNLNSIKEDIEKENLYKMLSNHSSFDQNSTDEASIHKENEIQRAIKDVFNELAIESRRDQLDESKFPEERHKKVRRQHSFSDTTNYEKKKDYKNTGSYPSSPRTIKNKSMPPIIEPILPPNQLPDNVYSESVPSKNPKSIDRSKLTDFGCQTPPFDKIEAFRKHMKKKKERIFDNTLNPLDAIGEKPDDNGEAGGPNPLKIGKDRPKNIFLNDKKNIPISSGPITEKKEPIVPVMPNTESKIKSDNSIHITEEDKSRPGISVIKPTSLPQTSDQETHKNMSKPMTLDESKVNEKGRNEMKKEPSMASKKFTTPNKTLEAFEDNGRFQYSSENLKVGPLPIITCKEAKKEETKASKKKDEMQSEVEMELNVIIE